MDKKTGGISIRKEISKNPENIKKITKVIQKGGGSFKLNGRTFVLKKTGIATQAI